VLSIVFTLMVGGVAGATAQDSEGLDGVDSPELTITITPEGFEAPATVEAGRVLVTIDNTLDEPAAAVIVQLAPGGDTGSLESQLPPEGLMEGQVNPAGGVPQVLNLTTWAGGTYFALPGVPYRTIVEFTPGDWTIVAPESQRGVPAQFTVTGEAQPGEAPAADVSVAMEDFQIVVPEQINAGPQVWEIANTGQQPHQFFLFKMPGPVTVQQAMQLLTFESGGPATPPPGMPNEEEIELIDGVAPVSPGGSVLVEFDLDPGTYLAFCTYPERASGESHFHLGMLVVFTVGAEGETVPLPASPVPAEMDES
jgi:hypothetical protein